MPGLTLGAAAKDAAKNRFRSFNLTLPTVAPGSRPTLYTLTGQLVQPPPPLGKPVIGAQRAGSVAANPLPFPPALFKAGQNNKDNVDYQKGMSDLYNGLFDALLDAIASGFNQYKATAGLVDVQINGPIATGGRLQGPPIDDFIRSAPSVAGWGNYTGKIRDAVAKGFQMQWKMVASSVRVPGLPWYPGFVAVPSPQAPPMPNVPTPFSALVQDNSAMDPSSLKVAMKSCLSGNVDFADEFFDSLSTGLQLGFGIWKGSQMVTNVLGNGPVPSFAPPYVPVGPVVKGSNIPGPHIAG
ncbi:MAG: hypothetical protein ABI759_20210 [Candidatus Solibacter sp.]